MKAEVEPNLDDATGFSLSLDHRRQLSSIAGGGLLNEHMFAGFDRG